MRETALELVQRMLKEGRSTAEIRDALNGRTPDAHEPILKSSVANAVSSSPVIAPPASSAIPGSSAASPSSPVQTERPFRQPVTGVIIGLMHRLGPVLGWLCVSVFCLAPAVIVGLDGTFAGKWGTLPDTLLNLGDITGVIGLAMYTLNLVLATRAHWLEPLFGGLNRVFTAHALVGSGALAIILIHPLITAGSYYEYGVHTVAHFFVPQLAYLGTAFGIVALAAMIVLIFLTLYAKLAYKFWLKTHKLLGVVYLLIALHVLLTPNQLTVDPLIRTYLNALLTIGVVCYIYRTLLPNIFVRRYLYTIQKAETKGIGVVEVTLRPVTRALHFRAGQFVYISFGNDALSREWHPFSISSPDIGSDFTLDIRSLGAYTETLTELLPYMVGTTVLVEGAYGGFSFRNFGNVNQVWIAGGIGITPFLSMARELGDGPYNIDLYYSVKTRSELIDVDALAAQQSNRPGQVFRVFPFIADQYKTFLSADIVEANTGHLNQRDFLLCGPPPMMASLTGQLVKMGVHKNHIHSEEFSF